VIVSLALGPGDSYVAVGFMNGKVGIHDTALLQPMMTFQAHHECLRSLAISPTGLIATASEDKTVKLWTWEGVVSGKRTLQGHTHFVMAVAFAPKDPIVFTGSIDETIRGWSQDSGDELFVLSGPLDMILHIDTHPTEKAFVTCGANGLVCVWEHA
jgi:coatomer subunit beta'